MTCRGQLNVAVFDIRQKKDTDGSSLVPRGEYNYLEAWRVVTFAVSTYLLVGRVTRGTQRSEGPSNESARNIERR